MEQALLLALQAVLGLAQTASSSQITTIINYLIQIIPIAVKLGEGFYTVIKNIITALRGQTSDADLLAQLDAADAAADAEFDALAAQASPALAAQGKAAADAAATGDAPAGAPTDTSSTGGGS